MIGRYFAIAGMTLAALSVPSFARAEEFVNMIRYFDSNGVAHYVGSLDQVPPEYRAGAKVPDADLRMPPVTSVGNDRSGRQTWEVEYKRRREEREKQIQKMDQEFRDLQQREAGPQAESAARKSVRELNEREKRLQEGRDATDTRNEQHARWLASCERQERIIEQDRARHWLAYGQRWTEEETAARKRRAIAESGCRPLK
jgi:hypothetical protein